MSRGGLLDQPDLHSNSGCQMNAIPPKRLDPHEDDQITDIIIPADELQRLYEDRRREKTREERRARVKRLLGAGAIAGLVAVCGAEAVAIAVMLPLKEFIPL